MPPANSTPLPHQRRRQILEELAATGAARVADLAPRLGVTEETVRRDLERLHAEGQLQRIHGGAIPVGSDQREVPLKVRQTTRVAEKRAIAALAAAMVVEGDVLAIDSSSTAFEVARLIPNQRLVVVTNGIDALRELARRSEVQVYSTGGQLLRDSGSLIGALAEGAIRQFGITKAIVSCKGIEAGRGASEATVEHAAMKRAMLAMADDIILLADHSKLGVQSTSYFASAAECRTLITDNGAEQAQLQALRSTGLNVLVASPSTSV